MRGHALRTVPAAGVLGAGAGALVALVGHWWASGRDTDFGYSSFTPTPDATTISIDRRTDWWQLLWPAVLTGLVVAVLASIVLTARRQGVRPLPRGWRGLLALAAVGLVLGGAVGGTLYLRAGSADETVYHGRYVPLEGTELSDGAYDSTLSVTPDEQRSSVAAFLAVCAGVGLGCGVVTGGLLMVSRRASGAA